MIAILLRAAALAAGALLAQENPNGQSPKVPDVTQVQPADAKLSDASSVDEILDALDRRGQGLKDFSADVTLDEIDTALMDKTSRSGTAVYQRKGEGDARIRVVFDTKRQGRKILDQKVEYILDNGWLIERDHDPKRRKETRRQVVRPGQKLDLLKLGEGPFPLPVGQPKESVQKLFTVTKVQPDPNTDPEGTVHIKLTPQPDTQFARKFTSIDVWVDVKTEMPRRIKTLDANQTTERVTDLKIKQVNQGVKDADFAPEPTEGEWERHDEPYVD